MLVIVLVIAGIALPLISRLKESHPTTTLVITVIALGAVAVFTILATVQSVQLQGWKVGITMPLVIILSLVLIGLWQRHQKTRTEGPRNNVLEDMGSKAPNPQD